MNGLLTTLNNSLPLFLTLGVVLFLRKKRIFKPDIDKALAPLLFKLVLPFFAFNAIYKLSFNLSDWPVLLVLLVINLLQIPLILYLSSIGRLNKALTGTLLLLCLSYSIGPVAYPFVQLNFAPGVFSKVVSIDIVLFVAIMIFGPIISSIFDEKNKTDYSKIVKSIVTDPVLMAVALGATLNALQVKLPDSVYDSILFIGQSFTFLVAVQVGLTLALPNTKELKMLVGSTIYRLIFALALSFAVISVFRPERELALAIPLCLFMAFSSFPLVYTEEHNLDSEFVAQASIFSRLVIIILYPILITILNSGLFI
jgi:predicted permease